MGSAATHHQPGPEGAEEARHLTRHFRSIAAVVVAGAALTGLVLAQAQTPAPAPPAGQPPAVQNPPAGRGAGRGTQAPPAGRGQRRGGFTQYTRELAPQDVLVRGQSLYEANCASCHAPDLRGTPSGTPNLLRSGLVFNDQHGELVAGAVSTHTPALTLSNADVVALAEYFHSVQATMGGQGSPPGRTPTNVTLNVLSAMRSGRDEYSTVAAAIRTTGADRHREKYPDPRNLQNAWFVIGRLAPAADAAAGAGNPPPTLARSKVEGTSCALTTSSWSSRRRRHAEIEQQQRRAEGRGERPA